MDYVAICIAILLWLVRPQDWLPGLTGVSLMTYVMLAGVIGLLKRPGGISFRLFFHSPCDWIITAYFIWIIWTTGDWFNTFKAVLPFGIFYFVTASSLDTTRKLRIFLSCWVIGLTAVVVFALSTHYGFELAPGSGDLTSGFLGRLTLNTWIYNNPNSLGHGVAALIPLAYIWWVWRRPAVSRVVGMFIIMAACQCVYLTESKGAYICGAAAITGSLIFRKPRSLQIWLLIIMMTGGVTALKMLPRMESLDNKEAGIAGRLLIWQMAYNAMTTTKTGEGWRKFEAWIDTADYGLIRKATHGSYVNVGADLGYVGLLLFVAVLYANSRTLLESRPDPENLVSERSQRALLSLTISFAASAWMIDRAYHTDFVILAGAVAAYHRQMTGLNFAKPLMEAKTGVTSLPAFPVRCQPPLLVANSDLLILPAQAELLPWRLAQGGASMAMPTDSSHDEDQEREIQRIGLRWPRLDQKDLILVGALFYCVIYIWQYVMMNFISF